MAEVFANAAQSTLAAAIGTGDVTLAVASATGFPASGNFRLLIDSEILLVTSVSGTTFTVSRAAEPVAGLQTATPHSFGATVTCVLTAGALAALPAGVTSVSNSDGTLTVLPTTGAVVASLNLGNANAWTAKQTFGANLITSPFGTGTANEAFGASAGNAAASGDNNTCVGSQAGDAITTGGSNTCVGQLAGTSITQGGNNCAFGVQALQKCTTGGGNMAVGLNALQNTVGGSNNTCVGINAGNPAVGSDPGDNSCIGYHAGSNVKAGSNVAIGTQSLGDNGTGASGGTCVAVGIRALRNVTSGADCVTVGYQAGITLTTGTQITLVGSQADVASAAVGPAGGFGYKAKPASNNEMAWSPYFNVFSFHQLSSTNADRIVGKITPAFSLSTDASYTGYIALSATDHAGDREGVRVDSNGSAPLLGFYGVATVARQLLATGAGHTVDDVITALQNLGLLRQS